MKDRAEEVSCKACSNRTSLNMVETMEKKKSLHTLPMIYARYRDHVFFSRCDPMFMKPQVREAIGWLVYECEDYIIVSWDRDAEPPTIHNGDPKASGLVLLRSDILELKRLG